MRFYQWLAWKLPKRLVYWCFVRVVARSSKEYPNIAVPDLTQDQMGRFWHNYCKAN